MDPWENKYININLLYENEKITHERRKEIVQERQIRAKSVLRRALETSTVPIFARALIIC